MVYLVYISYLGYTILVGNPRFASVLLKKRHHTAVYQRRVTWKAIALVNDMRALPSTHRPNLISGQTLLNTIRLYGPFDLGPSKQMMRSAVRCTANRSLFVGWLLALRPSNMLVYLRDGSAQTILRAATLRRKLQIKLSTSPSHSILTTGRPVPALTL